MAVTAERKTNERPGTKAVLRHYRMSATKARQVLELIRGQDVDRAGEILAATPRHAAEVVGKVLASAVANAVHNDHLDPDDLYVSACFADEGPTLKRWRPRARGRATRIRKRSCHITIVVSRLPDDRLARRRATRDAAAGQRARRVAASRRRADLSGRLSRRRAQRAEALAAAEAEAEQSQGAGSRGEGPDASEAPDADGGDTHGAGPEAEAFDGGVHAGGEHRDRESEGGEVSERVDEEATSNDEDLGEPESRGD